MCFDLYISSVWALTFIVSHAGRINAVSRIITPIIIDVRGRRIPDLHRLGDSIEISPKILARSEKKPQNRTNIAAGISRYTGQFF